MIKPKKRECRAIVTLLKYPLFTQAISVISRPACIAEWKL